LIFFPQGMDQLFGKSDLPWKPQMAGMVARSVMETSEGRQRYAACFGTLLTNLFAANRLTNRVNEIIGRLRPVLKQREFKNVETEADIVRNRIVQREISLRRQLSQPELLRIVFKDGVVALTGWVSVDEPLGGRMDQTDGQDGMQALHILAGPLTSSSWRTLARLGRGRYRFEGVGRVSAVKPLPFGKHQGAALRVAGRSQNSANIAADSAWRRLEVDFQVESNEEDVELVCELRASAGEAWFDKDSLRLMQLQ
jgi:hypothetical protein